MTITRAFGFTLDTKTGAVERWAAGDPASVAEHLPSHRPSGSQCVQFAPCGRQAGKCGNVLQSCGRDGCGADVVGSLPTLAQIRDKLGPLADVEVLGIVKPRKA